MKRGLLMVLMVGMQLLCSPLVVRAQAPVPDDFTRAIRDLAEDFARIIEKEGGGSVIVGEFAPATGSQGSVSPRIQKTLATELQRLKINVVEDGSFKYEIKGDYQSVIQQANGNSVLAVRLTGRLIDAASGDILNEKPKTLIVGPESVSVTDGLTVSLDGLLNDIDRLKAVTAAHQKVKQGQQGFVLNNTVLSARADSQYAMEILVRDGDTYTARTLTNNKGQPFVDLPVEAIYAVRLINRSSIRAAVELRVDGVNSFEFSDTGSSFWIIEPNSAVEIRGWHRTNVSTTEFRVVEKFEDGAAFKVKLSSKSTGLITAAFRAAWGEGDKPPADEPGQITENGGQERKVTGFGKDIAVETKQVNVIIGAPRDILAVRYDRGED